MSENFYATPEADLDQVSGKAPFYVVSTGKFMTLMVATLGLYGIYWFYRNWTGYRDYSGERIWPVPRAIFAIFFVHALFRHVIEKAEEEDVTVPFKHGSSTFQYVFIAVLSFVLSQFSQRNIGSPLTDIAGVLLMFLLVWVMLPVQEGINRVCADAEGEGNSQITTANVLWILFGLLMWVLMIIGVFTKV
jgi:hypothetical protein